MPSTSDRLALPLLDAGQAQKELFHNEALTAIDLLLHGAVTDSGVDDPPSSPIAGECWIVGASPTGAWAGRMNAIAGWTSGGWRFIAPRVGMQLWSIAQGFRVHYDGLQWVEGIIPAASIAISGLQIIGAQAAAIVDPSGGSTIDTEARATIAQLLTALRTHGLIAT